MPVLVQSLHSDCSLLLVNSVTALQAGRLLSGKCALPVSPGAQAKVAAVAISLN